jgi:hypothetical protein
LRGYADIAVSEIIKHVFCSCKLELARRVSANTNVCCSIAIMVGVVGDSDNKDFCPSVSCSIPCALNAFGNGEMCQATAVNPQTFYIQEHNKCHHDSPTASDALEPGDNFALVQVAVLVNATLMYHTSRVCSMNAQTL